mgnify:CR=1 FL=1
MELPGKTRGLPFWTSSGNPNRKGTGCDRAHPLTKKLPAH